MKKGIAEINGCSKPKGVFTPGSESVAGPLASDSIRLYVFYSSVAVGD